MRRALKKTATHDTAVMRKNALVGEELTDFHEGDRVMTVDGYPGRVTAVSFGPFQASEDYEVTLDNGVGGGTYSVGQLRPYSDGYTASVVEAAEITASIPIEASTDHTADLDYPELGDILTKRLPNENIKIYAARVNDGDEAQESPSKSEDPGENLEQDQQFEDPDEKPEGIEGDATEEPEDQTESGTNVTPPSACSFCGHDQFEDPQMTGRGVRIRCAQCKGTMKSWGGQWEPEFPNSSQNNASEMWDYRSGGPGGVVQAPGVNYKASSLEVQAGIVNWIVDKVYDRMKERKEEDENKWWLPPLTELHPGDSGVQGPANYATQNMDQHTHTGSVSELGEHEWLWHFTSSWMDVQAKARKIKREGHVKILVASSLHVVGEVQGDTAVYESQLNYVPGTKKVADWACGCKWGSYTWGRSQPYARFEGRLCSHALALQYEAGARGMFGREVSPDTKIPDWQKIHQPVVTEYDKFRDRNLTRRVSPPANMKRTFSSVAVDSDGIYAHPEGMDLIHPPVYATVEQMIGHNEPIDNVFEHLASLNVDGELARTMVFDALSEHPDAQGAPRLGFWSGSVSELLSEAAKADAAPEVHDGDLQAQVVSEPVHRRDLSDHDDTPEERELHKKHRTNDAREHAPHWGWGYPAGIGLMMCPQCNGSGCGHCAGLGQVPTEDESTATQSPTDATPDQTADAGSAIGSDGVTSGGATGSLKTADYSSADPLVSVDDQSYYTPTPHSNTQNPGSTGWATSQDPGDWGRSMISNNFGVTFDASLHTAATHPDGEDGPTVSGVALKAADTGRVLMIQRSNKDDKDPARGTWEFPGGHHEEDDLTSLHAGIREWQEETGQSFPRGGHVTHVWRQGPYAGHVVVIPSEQHVDFSQGRSLDNPDDPDGDDHEQAAWWDPSHAQKNPALRSELKKSGPWDSIKKAASRDPDAAWKHEPDHSGANGKNHKACGYPWKEHGEKPDGTQVCPSYGKKKSSLNDEPEAALPETDGGVVDNDTGFAVNNPDSDDAASILAGDTVDGPHLPSSDVQNSYNTTAAIIAEFQRSAGAQALAQSIPKTAMKEFSFAEQQDLINEGKGDRARNFDDLRVAGTHYELIGDDDADETILWI